MNINKKENDFGNGSLNSKTKLANYEIKVSNASSENFDSYNPFEHRNLSHANSDFGAFAHFLKCSFGTGILAMPNAVRSGGLVFGLIGIVVVGIICTHCVHILVKSSHRICKKIKVPSLGFSETAQAVIENGPKNMRKFGPAVKIIVDVALLLTYCMTTCVYVVFVAGSIQQLVDHYFPDLGWAVYIYMLILLFPLTLICQVRELKILIPLSALANVFLIVSFVITIYYIFNGKISTENRKLIGSIDSIPIFLSTVVFAIEGIGMAMPLENKMKTPEHFLGCPGILNSVMTFSIVLHSVVGVFGYIKYGEDTKGSITYNFPIDEGLAQSVKALVATAIFLTYALQFYVAYDITWKYVSPHISPKNQNIWQILLRTTAVVITVGVAAAVPDLETIISLVGAICLSILGILIPVAIETVIDCEDGFGIFKWKLWKNVLLALFSFVVLIAGTWKSINDIIKNYNLLE